MPRWLVLPLASVLLLVLSAPAAEPTPEELRAAGAQLFKAGINRSATHIDPWTGTPHQLYYVPSTMLKMNGLAKLPNVGIDFGLAFARAGLPNDGIKDLAGLANLTVLDMSDLDVSELALPNLKLLPKLERLTLGGGKLIGNKGVKSLAECPRLTTLDLYETAVTSVGLKDLTGCRSLKYLRVGRTGVPAAAVPGLVGLEVVGPFQVTVAQVREWKELKNLTHLHLPKCTLADGAAAELAGMKRLVSLDLSETNAGDPVAKVLQELPALEVLRLHGTRVTNLGVKEVAGLKALRELTMQDTRVTEAGIVAAAGAPALQTCSVSPRFVTDAVLKGLARAKRLHILRLAGTLRPAKGVEREGDLLSLFLSKTAVTDAGLAELTGLTGLKTLFLDGTAVTDKGMTHLLGLDSLDILELTDTKVTDKGLLALAAHKSLSLISIRRSSVTEAGVLAFRKLNPACRVDR